MKLTPNLSDRHRIKWAKRTIIVAASISILALLIYLSSPESSLRQTTTTSPQARFSNPSVTTPRQGTDANKYRFRPRPDVTQESVVSPVMPAGVAQVLASQPERLTRLETAFARWHREHPELAGKLIDLVGYRLGVSQSSETPQEWTPAELLASVGLVLELEAPDDRLPFLSEVARLLASVDPAGALGLLKSFESAAEKAQFLGEILDGWMEGDSNAALAWVLAEPSGADREMMLERVVQSLVQTNPALAGSIVAEHIESPQAQATALRTVMSRWAAVDTQSAAEWLSRFPPGEPRMEMLHVLVVSWRGRDELAFKKWVNGLPPGDLREQTEALWERIVTESGSSH